MEPSCQCEPLLEVRNISKCYGTKGREASSTRALDHVSLLVARGEFAGIMGPSGSGKSTLLNCISTIDAPTEGTITIDGRDITALSGKSLAAFRRERLGFVFQDANLLDTLTAYENIALALTIRAVPAREIDARVRAIAEKLSVADTLEKHPYQLSGGQRQRIAAARACVGRPSLVLADEPTGALDSASAIQLLETFALMNRLGTTILMVTHDPSAASWCSRIVLIKDGRTFGQIERGNRPRSAFLDEIARTTARMGEGADDAC